MPAWYFKTNCLNTVLPVWISSVTPLFFFSLSSLHFHALFSFCSPVFVSVNVGKILFCSVFTLNFALKYKVLEHIELMSQKNQPKQNKCLVKDFTGTFVSFWNYIPIMLESYSGPTN